MRWATLLWAGMLFDLFADAAIAQSMQIVAVGDSNTAGKGVSSAESYPSQLEAALRRNGLSVTVRNAGINGDTTANVLARVDGVVPSGTDLAILWIGVNDCRRRVPHDVIEANVGAILDRLQARARRIVMSGAPCLDLRGVARSHRATFVALGSAFTSGNRLEDDPHLSGAGYAAVVRTILPAVQASLGKARSQ